MSTVASFPTDVETALMNPDASRAEGTAKMATAMTAMKPAMTWPMAVKSAMGNSPVSMRRTGNMAWGMDWKWVPRRGLSVSTM